VSTLGVVFVAEFGRRIRSRAFLVGTILGAASLLLIATIPSFLGNALSNASKRVVLVGDPALTVPAASLLARDFDVVATLPQLDAPPTPAFLDAHRKAAAVAILRRDATGLRVVAYTRDPSSFRSVFGRDLAPIQVALATGAPVERVAAHLRVPVDVRDVEGRFADVASADAAKGVAYVFVMLLYLAILLNAQQIMTSVAEEKTSRIAELLVATIDPSQLLAAKILATAATAFIQLAVWVATGILAGSAAATTFSSNQSSAPSIGVLDVGAVQIVAFVAFFTVGFAQYGVLYAAAASLINRTEDLGSVAAPLVVPVIAGILLAQFGLQFPNSPQMAIVSFIPLVSPFVMFTREVVSNVPLWQLALSLAINVATAVALAYLAGKVYRVGLLLYGRSPSLKQIAATLRT